MFRILKFFLFFLLCLAVALVINLPIQQVLPYVKLSKSVQLIGVDGRLMEGRAVEVVVNRFPLRNVKYRFLPACLVQLKVCYQIDYQQGQIQLGYDILNGDTEISRSRIDYPVSELLARSKAALPVKPGGQLELVIDESSMLQNKVIEIKGKLIWHNLGVDDNDIQIDIGDYQVDFVGSNTKYEFTFSDLDASLDITGDGSMNADGTYEVDVKVSSQDSIDPQIKSVLDLIAVRSSINKYRIQQSGRLPNKIASQLFR